MTNIQWADFPPISQEEWREDNMQFMWRTAVQTGMDWERNKIAAWLRALDGDSGDINRFLPSTLANWIDEGMHQLYD